jgi:sec-independent protein translocase protein TatA
MFKGIGTTELIILFVILLVLFGGKKLPELGRGIGDAIREFKKSLKNKE